MKKFNPLLLLFGFILIYPDLSGYALESQPTPVKQRPCQLYDAKQFSTPITMSRTLFSEDEIAKLDLPKLSRNLLEVPLPQSLLKPTGPSHSKRGDRGSFKPADYDIPVVLNAQVVKWLDYFQGPGRTHFIRWYSRYESFSPMIKQSLRQSGLPEDLIFLAMIESGFQPVAKSRARAVGMWQFMQRTGQQYGLEVDYWVDERRDPIKATLAAAEHIKDLYQQFQDWYLVAASYNAGAGKIEKAISKTQSTDYWEIAKSRYIRPETKDYVPKMIAAAIIVKNPQAYGFRGVQFHQPWQFEILQVDQFSDLTKISRSANVTLKTLRDLNPELRHPFTPPGRATYPLRVPVGTAQLLSRLQEEDRFAAPPQKQFVIHKVRRRETLSGIGRLYGVPTMTLMEINDINSAHRLTVGMSLRIPVKPNEAPRIRRTAMHYIESSDRGTLRYRVRPGDSLWSISRHFGVRTQDIKHWNPQISGNKIYAGLNLKIKKSS